MLVVGGGLCPGTSINDRQADRTPGQPLTKSCSPCPQPGVPSPSCVWRAESFFGFQTWRRLLPRASLIAGHADDVRL